MANVVLYCPTGQTAISDDMRQMLALLCLEPEEDLQFEVFERFELTDGNLGQLNHDLVLDAFQREEIAAVCFQFSPETGTKVRPIAKVFASLEKSLHGRCHAAAVISVDFGWAFWWRLVPSN